MAAQSCRAAWLWAQVGCSQPAFSTFYVQCKKEIDTMVYNTPELLLVGAAQNLVLGGSFDKEPEVCQEVPDSETAPINDYLEDSSW
jgi:hypothetical protein